MTGYSGVCAGQRQRRCSRLISVMHSSLMAGNNSSSGISLPSRPPLRGSPSRKTNFMEALQESYLRAVMASAGCVFAGKPEIDEGVDILISHTSNAHLAGDSQALLQVQLKATTSIHADHISASLSKERYNQFASTNPAVHKIIVLMYVPALQQHWTYARTKGLTIHHCAYWVNIAGSSMATTKQKSVSAKRTDVFNDVALCDIMERIGQGLAP
jgi:hypothetical protein